MTPALSRLAAELFTTRQAKAREAVRARATTERQASEHLRPWLAIACLAHADLPELEEPLADQRVTSTDGTPFLREGELRALAAAEICPREKWEPLLIKATDHAMDKATPEDQPSIDRALDLLALCRALGATEPWQTLSTKQEQSA